MSIISPGLSPKNTNLKEETEMGGKKKKEEKV